MMVVCVGGDKEGVHLAEAVVKLPRQSVPLRFSGEIFPKDEYVIQFPAKVMLVVLMVALLALFSPTNWK